MGICLCFTWLSHLWSHFIGSSTSQDMASLEILPDDVMTDVLSLLPADQVSNLRRVCKGWCSLTATPYFVQLHLERTPPVMIFQTRSSEHIDHNKFTLFSVDWSSKKKKQLIREIGSQKFESLLSEGFLRFVASCNGFFIFKRGMGPFQYYIFNPIIREKKTFTLRSRYIVGFFFNSVTNKYQAITYGNFSFYIGNFEPITRWRKVGSFPYRPRELFAPSVVNGCLHWMAIGKQGGEDILPPCAHSIMVFSTDDCRVRFLPHPGKVDESCQGHQNMHLLATKGHLHAYGMYAKILDIWVLEDSTNWYWVKKFSIHLERYLRQYSIDDISIMSYQTKFQMKLIDIWKDEVLLVVPEKGFFRYHMRLKTITEAQFAHTPVEGRSYTHKLCDVIAGRSYTRKLYEVIAIESTKSFHSLKDLWGLRDA